MAYVDPPDFTALDVLAADELDVISEDIRFLYGRSEGATFSAVQVSRTTNQSIANDTVESIVWNAENLDVGGWWSSGAAVVTPAGAIPDGATTVGLLCVVNVTFASDPTGKRQVRFLKNGSGFGQVKVPGLDDDATYVAFTEVTTVAALDEIEVEVWQNSGGSLVVTAARLTLLRQGVAS
jgi:hypothetical protein